MKEDIPDFRHFAPARVLLSSGRVLAVEPDTEPFFEPDSELALFSLACGGRSLPDWRCVLGRSRPRSARTDRGRKSVLRLKNTEEKRRWRTFTKSRTTVS